MSRVWSLGREDPLEKGMTTYSSILAWRIPWTEEAGGLQSMRSQRVGHNWACKRAWNWPSEESQRRVPAIDQEKKNFLIVLLGARCGVGPMHHGRLEVEKEMLCAGPSWSPSFSFRISSSWGGRWVVQVGWGDDWQLHVLFECRAGQLTPWLSSWDNGAQEWLSEVPTVGVRSYSTFWPWWSSWSSELPHHCSPL